MVKLNKDNPQTAAFTFCFCFFLFTPLCILNTQGMCALYPVTGNVGISITTEILHVKTVSLTINYGQNLTM